MKTGRFFTNGAFLAYDTTGSGEPVVFIHGFSLDMRMWDSQVSHFARAHCVVRYDLRGFGVSDTPHKPYAHIDDLMALLRHLGIAKAHVVGFSLGGTIAIDFALTYPNSVRTLTLVDTALGGYKGPTDWKVDAGMGLTRAKEQWISHEVFRTALAHPTVSDKLRTILSDYSGWHWLNKDPKTRLSPPALARLHELVAPVQLIIGEHDLIDFHEIADLICSKAPNAVRYVLNSAGHMSNMEKPEEFNNTLAAFLAAHGDSGT